MDSPTPFFTNDAGGYIRLAFLIFSILGPTFGLVVWFLRRGPDQRINKVEGDVTALGRKVDEMGNEAARDRERTEQMQRELANHHREQLDLLRTSSAAIQAQIHSVGIEVARLQERSNIGQQIKESFDKYGREISAALREQSRGGKSNGG